MVGGKQKVGRQVFMMVGRKYEVGKDARWQVGSNKYISMQVNRLVGKDVGCMWDDVPPSSLMDSTVNPKMKTTEREEVGHVF